MTDERKIHFIPLEHIDATNRIRKDKGDVEELAKSIERHTDALPNTSGLIHPILVEQTRIVGLTEEDFERNGPAYQLIAGGRRLEAHKLLNRPTIACISTSDLREDQLLELELAENFERKSMTWQEECLQVHKIHDVKKQNAVADMKSWGHRETGRLLKVSHSHISNCIVIARCINLDDQEIATQPNMTAALAILLQRDIDDKTKKLINSSATLILPPTPTSSRPSGPITFDEEREDTDRDSSPTSPSPEIQYNLSETLLNTDCQDFMEKLGNECIDHIVTDPPYGINMDNLRTDTSRIDDQHKVDGNLDLIQEFLFQAYRILKPTSFLLMWYDLDHHEKIGNYARHVGYKVQRWPYIWIKLHSCSNSTAQFNLTKATEVCYFLRKSEKATLITQAFI